MMYVSTRDPATDVGFETAILNGLAPDGGLYVPKSVPRFAPADLERLAHMTFAQQATDIHAQFSGDALRSEILRTIVEDGYQQFRHESIAPLVEIAPGRWIMELFHGPTLAFKDHAMQYLVPLMGHLLEREGRSAFVLCATSGDTGGAALSALGRVQNIRALVLYPQGGVSMFQERQMQSLSRSGCRAVPVLGSFDDCQRLMKAVLARADLQQQFGLTAVNSVNWGRIAAQTVYYAHASLKLARPSAPVNFVVPTGNFGNAYAGVIAKRMGFPVGQLIVATNDNDVLVRALDTGVFQPEAAVPTNTPAMDIQAASNFERLIYDLDPSQGKAATSDFMQSLQNQGHARLSEPLLKAVKDQITVERVSQRQTTDRMRHLFERTGYIADPHTAIGVEAADRHSSANGQTVVLATAHPAKFADTVENAIGARNLPDSHRTPPALTEKNEAAIAPDMDRVIDMISAIADD